MKNNFFKSTMVVFVMTMSYRIIGFIREMLIAYSLGASLESDAYYLAFTTPNLIINLIAFGAISSVAVPIFVKYIDINDINSVSRVFNKTASIMFVVLVILTIVLMLNTNIIVKVLAPGFSGNTFELSVILIEKMLPSIIFIGLLGLIISVLQSFKEFFIAAFSNFIFNLILVIFSIVFIYYRDILILAYAVPIAAFIQFLVVVLRLKSKHISLKFDLNTNDKDVCLLFQLLLPILFGTIVTQINFAVGRGFASTLEQGSLSALNYADKLINLPIGVLVGSVLVVIYPSLASSINNNDQNSLSNIIEKSSKAIFFITIPIIIIFNFLSIPIVNVLFERGDFSNNNTLVTASALASYSYGIIGMAFTALLNKIFYAYKDTWTPLKISLISMILNICLIFILLPNWGYRGIALSFSISSILNAFILIFIASKQKIFFDFHLNTKAIINVLIIICFFISTNIFLSQYYNIYCLESFLWLKVLSMIIIFTLLFFLYIFLLNFFNIFNIKEMAAKLLSKNII